LHAKKNSELARCFFSERQTCRSESYTDDEPVRPASTLAWRN
jgi:hypothetical protein